MTLYYGGVLLLGSALILFFAGFPLVWMFVTSIKPAARLQRTWWLVRQATRFHACLPGAGVKHTRFSNA